MGGTQSSRGGLIAAAALFGALVSASLPARGQARPDYRTASPPALVQAWKSAPREERNAIAAAMIARRAQVLPTLWDAARFGDRQEKLLALGMIAEMRDRDGVDALLAATGDPDVKVRRRAATALRILADPRSAARLRELLRTESDLGVLKTTLAALGRLGQRRDGGLIEPFLGHGDHGVRVVAAGSLAMLDDQRGLDLVIQATTAADPSVQKSATYALGLFAAAAAGQRLAAILGDPQGAWKSYALIALAERRLAIQSSAEQIATLDALARGRSRNLAEWAVDRLTDIGTAEAAEVLRAVRDRQTPVGPMAERRLRLLEGRR
jgi:HEAT repeat protein